MTRGTRLDVALSLPGVMIRPPTAKRRPSFRMEFHLAGPIAFVPISIDLHRLVAIDTETLRLMTTGAIRIVLACRNCVRENPVVRVNFERLRNTIMAIDTELGRMTIVTALVVHLGDAHVIFQPVLIMSIPKIPASRL